MSGLVSGRCHEKTLKHLVCVTVNRYAQEGASQKGAEELGVQNKMEAANHAAGEESEQVLEAQKWAAPLLACCVIERSLFDLYHQVRCLPKEFNHGKRGEGQCSVDGFDFVCCSRLTQCRRFGVHAEARSRVSGLRYRAILLNFYSILSFVQRSQNDPQPLPQL